jgi:hypothetical protein
MSDSCRIGCLRTAAILACASLAWASVQFTQAQEAPARPASVMREELGDGMDMRGFSSGFQRQF